LGVHTSKNGRPIDLFTSVTRSEQFPFHRTSVPFQNDRRRKKVKRPQTGKTRGTGGCWLTDAQPSETPGKNANEGFYFC
jgi:hypothetical protein